MDLIKQLINNKKNSDDVETTFTKLLDEIIKYERLSKSPKFKTITDSPVLQKQLPTIWQAFNKDSQKMYLFENAIGIVSELSDQPLDIVTEYRNHYNKREKKQLELIGNATNVRVHYYEFRQLPPTFDVDGEYLILQENDKDIHKMSLILFEPHRINVYTGVISNVEEKEYQSKRVYEPYVETINNNQIIIFSYSIQGNNDYPFGTVNNLPIEFPTTNTFRWGQQTIPLTAEDEFERTQICSNVHLLAEYCLKLCERIPS